MNSTCEKFAQSVCETLQTIKSIRTVERDRVEALAKEEGVSAVVEIGGETFEHTEGGIHPIYSTLRSSASVVIYLLSWNTDWARELDAISIEVVKKVMNLAQEVDFLRLTKRDWTPRSADRGFGILSMTFEYESICNSLDISIKK